MIIGQVVWGVNTLREKRFGCSRNAFREILQKSSVIGANKHQQNFGDTCSDKNGVRFVVFISKANISTN